VELLSPHLPRAVEEAVERAPNGIFLVPTLSLREELARRVGGLLSWDEVLPAGERRRLAEELARPDGAPLAITPQGLEMVALAHPERDLVVLDGGLDTFYIEQEAHLWADLAAPLLSPARQVWVGHPGLSEALCFLGEERGEAIPRARLVDPRGVELPPGQLTEAEMLAEAVAREVASEGVTVVFHHRSIRGRWLVCMRCLAYQRCPVCSTPLRLLEGGRAWCPEGHGTHPELVQCQQCGSEELARAGFTLTDLERELSRRLSLPIIRVDAGHQPDLSFPPESCLVLAGQALIYQPCWRMPVPERLIITSFDGALLSPEQSLAHRLDPLIRLTRRFAAPLEEVVIVTQSGGHPAALAWAEGGGRLVEFIRGEAEVSAELGGPPWALRVRVAAIGERGRLKASRKLIRRVVKELGGMPAGRSRITTRFKSPHLFLNIFLPPDLVAGRLLMELEEATRDMGVVVRLAADPSW